MSQMDHSTDQRLIEKTTAYCKEVVSGVLKMDKAKIDASEPMGNLGIDSIMVGQISARFQEDLVDISSTLLFESRTINALSGNLIAAQREQLIELFELKNEPEIPAVEPRVDKVRSSRSVISNKKNRRPRRNRRLPVGDKNIASTDKVAIVGISGMYPQAPNLDIFWENIEAGRNCIGEIPSDRWSLDGFFNPDVKAAVQNGQSYCKWGGFLEGFSDFDADFFGISPQEVLSIDPQERIFLQSAWQTLESAGYTRDALRTKFGKRVGVFVGVSKIGYGLYGSSDTIREQHFFPRNSFSSIPNRLSYFLDITGPSMPIDTMCSSSLTAIHEACEHIYRDECEMAIAGGVNLYLHPNSYIDLAVQGMLSKEGVCRSFGEGADGFAPGEGVGAVLLKRLSCAIRDRDVIHGIILGTHVNHSGRSNGYTRPNPIAQTEVIKRAIEKSGISPRSISYIEAHGTGTELGDSIEISVLEKAFSNGVNDTAFCDLGSIKSNIGHCEAAAGISALTKVVLQMRHNKIAPSLHSSKLNPHIKVDGSAFTVNQSLKSWQRPVIDGKELPRIAGISSFGAGGCNAHIVIQEYVEPASSAGTRRTETQYSNVPIVLSAMSEDQLSQKASELLDFLCSKIKAYEDETSVLVQVAYTLQIGREAMEHRLAIMAESIPDLKLKLKSVCNGDDVEDVYLGSTLGDKEALSLFASDTDLQATIEKWLEDNKLSNLLRLWVKGLDLDWSKIYGDNHPYHIELPPYPFAKKSYWIDSFDISAVNTRKSAKPVIHPSVPEKHLSAQMTASQRASSANTISTLLKHLVSDQVDKKPSDVQTDVNFLDLGLDSIGIMNVLRKLNESLQESLLPNILFEYSDIDALSNYLEITFPKSVGSLSKCDIYSTQHETQSGELSANMESPGEKKIASQLLVPMQKEGSGFHIFALPGGPGNVLAFLSLSRFLGKKVRFFGIQPLGLNGETAPLKDMNDIVKTNIATLKSIQASGPYTLLGYSNGGVVAYEMVRQLLKGGEEVSSLILLDTLCPLERSNDLISETVYVAKNFMKTLDVNLKLDTEKLNKISEDKRCSYLYDIMTSNGLNISEEQFVQGYTVAEASYYSCRHYSAEKLPLSVNTILYRAKNSYKDVPADYGWGHLLRNRVQVVDIDADHFSIVEDKASRKIADSLLRIMLNKAKTTEVV